MSPWQSVHYMAVRTTRRVVGRREDLQKVLEKWLSIEADGTANESAGAASVLGQAMAAVGWKLETDLYITRENGGKLHLTEGEDGLFDLMFRADLRQAVSLRDTRMYKRREFDGIRKGVDYEATVKPMRERFKPKKNKAGARPI